ncbi:hypothetical protein ACIP9X_05585 [Arthrobacter sp. NPDC093125]|uniref:hypothetical protein n=1 Tax=Arthrobacter sp. NPDC093125 TaxID=3363944 RepID=UPI00380F792D
MDANLWKLLVDKVIRKTESQDLLWSETHQGPSKTLSFGTSIDGSTTLNIWGYETNYSYELCLTKQTAGGPFEERRRVTTKKSAEGIDFSGLFKAVQRQVLDITRERAFGAVLEALANPPLADSEEEAAIYERLEAMGDRGYFLYSQDEKVLALVRDLTVAGSLPWQFVGEVDGEEGQCFSAEVAKLGPYLEFRVIRTPNKPAAKTRYIFEVSNEGSFWVRVHIDPNKQVTHQLWALADEIHSVVSKDVRNDEAEFEKIVRDNIVHDILASLDDPSK